MKYCILSCLLTAFVYYGIAKPTNELDVVAYLKQFHYLRSAQFESFSDVTPSKTSPYSEDKLRKALTHFQIQLGLKITGEMNDETRKTMESPRCGLSDFNSGGNIRFKRYATSGARWARSTITYRIRSYTAKMSKRNVIIKIRKALAVWSKYTPLRFIRRTRGYATIMIDFKKYEHGDFFPFDGPGNTLAHAFYPRGGGDVHFDESEKWAKEGGYGRGVDLRQVAAHEFGHSLGLKHSSVKGAVMYPTYMYMPKFRLHADDIGGIRRLYGRR